MSFFNPLEVYCQKPLLKITTGHKSISMTVLCPSNNKSYYIQWIYIFFKIYITISALCY